VYSMDKLLFLNIGWMERYQGLESDTIAGEGAFVNKYNDPHDPETYPPCEIYNFQPYEGVMYGFVRIARGSIRIERLGASPGNDSIDGVLVVWVAKSPSDGTVIVGWYDDATVYRHCQPPPEGSGRRREGRQEWGHRVAARAENCTLLPPERRDFPIPRGRKGAMGGPMSGMQIQPSGKRYAITWSITAER
jgi:5-methylcytosine-specific restriction protein A